MVVQPRPGSRLQKLPRLDAKRRRDPRDIVETDIAFADALRSASVTAPGFDGLLAELLAEVDALTVR